MGNMAKYAAEQRERIARYINVRNAAIVFDGLEVSTAADAHELSHAVTNGSIGQRCLLRSIQ